MLLKKVPALQGRELLTAGSAVVLLALVRLQVLVGMPGAVRARIRVFLSCSRFAIGL